MSWPLEYTPLKEDEEVLAMLGRRSDLACGEHPYLDHVGRDSFYGFLNHPQRIISIHAYALLVVRRVFATLSPRSEPGFSATLLDSVPTV